MNLNRKYSNKIKDDLDLDDDLDDNNFNKKDDLDLDDDLDDFGGDFSGGVTPQEKHNDLLKDLTNFDKYLKKLTVDWLGLVWSDEKKDYIKSKNKDRLMNEKGVSWFINYIRTYARDNNILSSLTEDDYINIKEEVIETVYPKLYESSKKFEIKSTADMIKIGNQVYHTIILILSGAGKTGNYRDFLGTTVSRNENVSHREEFEQNRKNNNIFSKSFNWIRGKQ